MLVAAAPENCRWWSGQSRPARSLVQSPQQLHEMEGLGRSRASLEDGVTSQMASQRRSLTSRGWTRGCPLCGTSASRFSPTSTRAGRAATATAVSSRLTSLLPPPPPPRTTVASVVTSRTLTCRGGIWRTSRGPWETSATERRSCTTWSTQPWACSWLSSLLSSSWETSWSSWPSSRSCTSAPSPTTSSCRWPSPMSWWAVSSCRLPSLTRWRTRCGCTDRNGAISGIPWTCWPPRRLFSTCVSSAWIATGPSPTPSTTRAGCPTPRSACSSRWCGCAPRASLSPPSLGGRRSRRRISPPTSVSSPRTAATSSSPLLSPSTSRRLSWCLCTPKFTAPLWRSRKA